MVKWSSLLLIVPLTQQPCTHVMAATSWIREMLHVHAKMRELGVAKLLNAWVSSFYLYLCWVNHLDISYYSLHYSHVYTQLSIFTGMLGTDSPAGTMPTETSPWLENAVVFPRSLIVMGGHDFDCALTRRQASPSHIKNRDWTKSPLFLIHD